MLEIRLTDIKYHIARASGFMLLALFCYGSIGTKVTHLHDHASENEIVHSHEAETDSCHQSIYHGVSSSCDHETHLSSLIETCNSCHYFIQDDQLHEAIPLSLNHQNNWNIIDSDISDLISHESILSIRNKAPPTLC